MKLRPSGSALIAGWSFANVLFLEQWHQLLRIDNPAYSFFVTRLSYGNYVALFANVLLVGTLGAIVATIAATAQRRTIRVAAVLVLAIGFVYVLNSLRHELFPSGLPASALVSVGRSRLVAVIAMLVLGGAVVVITAVLSRQRTLERAARLIRGSGLVLSPFLLFTCGAAVALLLRHDPDAIFRSARTVADQASRGVQGRVAVILFDEADYRLMFGDRPAGISLPNFDHLRREAIFATRAFPPAGHTELSIPSYLTGYHVTAAVPRSARDVRLNLAEDPGRTRTLSSMTSLFSVAHEAGARVGVVGWSQPYCRLENQRLTECRARSGSTPPTTVLRAMLWQLGETATIGPFLDRAYGIGLPYHSLDYVELMKSANDMIGERGLDFVWLHLPVPHEPRIYDPRTRRFVGPELHHRGAYEDNLALADIALGQLRASAEKAGLWNATSVIVTSDHSYRLSARDDGRTDRRIPLLVKLSGASRSVEVADSIDTIHVRDLILELLERRMNSADVVQLLTRREAERGPGN